MYNIGGRKANSDFPDDDDDEPLSKDFDGLSME